MLIPITKVNEHLFKPNKYFVNTDNGNILSEQQFNPGCYNTLKPFTDGKRGYLKVKLYNTTGKGVTLFVHRIVYTFSKAIPYDSVGEINHINGIRTDNRSENLELISSKENVRHSIRNKLSPSRSHQMTLGDAIQIYGFLVQNVLYYSQSDLAKMIGYDPKIVRQLLTKTHTLSGEIEEYFNTNK